MSELISKLQEIVYFGNSLLKYCIDAGILIIGFIALTIIRRIILVKLLHITKKTSLKYDEIIISAVRAHLIPLGYFSIFYFCIFDLIHVPKLIMVFKAAIILISIFYTIRFILAITAEWIDNSWFKDAENRPPSNTKSVIINILKVALWVIGLLIFLDNIGVKVSAFIAGMGIGGIAIAFAAQAILVDVFSYFSIFFDKPFEVGDLVSVNDFKGTVEHIGMKTTRMRSVTGEQVVLPNTSLTGSRLHNFKRMKERRMDLKLDLTYDTKYAVLNKIPEVIQNIIEQTPKTRFSSCHFTEFMDSSLRFETVYYVLSPDFSIARDIQQNINLNIKKKFEKMGVEFAFPTQTLHITK